MGIALIYVHYIDPPFKLDNMWNGKSCIYIPSSVSFAKEVIQGES